MAFDADTFDSYNAKGMKESFSDLIFNISPTETPFLSMIGTNTAKQRQHQWQKDTLTTPTSATATPVAEGETAAVAEVSATTIASNYTQINASVFGVSGTLEVTEKYGRDSSMAYQTAKAARTLKTNVDFSMTGTIQESDLSVVGTQVRTSAAVPCWLLTNYNGGAGSGAAPAGGDGTTAPVDGNVRPFTQSMLDLVIKSAWENGGKPSVILAGGSQKTAISTFDGLGNVVSASTMRTDRADKTITATADMYISNFGDLRVVPSRHIYKSTGGSGAADQDRNVYVLDPELWKFTVLRPWQQFDLAKTGDTINRELLVEWTLQASNEAGSGMICDVNNA